MIPERKRSNEFFGFYEIFGKFSAIMGPFLFGMVGLWASKIIQRNNPGMMQEALDKAAAPYGVLSVLVIFIIGAVFFIKFLKHNKKGELEQSES
jgi:UMF1 family MFS transporter